MLEHLAPEATVAEVGTEAVGEVVAAEAQTATALGLMMAVPTTSKTQ